MQILRIPPRATSELDREVALEPGETNANAGAMIYRAAEQACRMEVRRVIPCREREAVGIVTGMDFVKLVAAT
jgi:hypothetical protein